MQPTVAKVFLSATKNDLVKHREAAANAILKAGLYPATMEFFVAEDSAAIDVCLREVEQCSALVAVVAHRYGWIPDDQPEPKDKSITWLECQHAKSKGVPILAFVVDEAYDWPHLRERDRVMAAYNNGGDVGAESAAAKFGEARLRDFKAWLGKGRIQAMFTTPDSLAAAVAAALGRWQLAPALPAAPPPEDPEAVEKYLEYLRNSTKYIELRGLKVGSGKANHLEISQLYVELKTAGGDKEQPRSVPLEHALRHPRLLIEGDAGSGKTTFLRRMAGELAKAPVSGFPVLLRVGELDDHIEKSLREAGAPAQRHSPDWIAHMLAAGPWGLAKKSVERRLGGPGAVLLLDGLDEAVNEDRRRSLLKLVAEAALRYPQCQIVVTTRPQAFRDALAGFEVAKIEELDDDAVARFLGLWSRALWPNDVASATKLEADLGDALRQSAEIRRMTKNPVMLTAMAVVYWNERRLPEARAELYESVLQWLARSRESKKDIGDKECLILHGKLAWWMQSQQGGRLTSVEKSRVVEALGPNGLAFVEAEVADSGILVSRGSTFKFWHLTFQEYLAARVLAGFEDQERHKQVVGREYHSEWREVMLLLGGVLLEQGDSKLRALFREIAAKAGATLPERAKCVELLSAILHDLGPNNFDPQCQDYSTMLGQMRRLFEEGGGKGIDIKTRAAAAEALGQVGHPGLFLPGQKEYWVEITGDTFLMGAQNVNKRKPNFDKDAYPDEPVHEVKVKAFQMGRYPVTVWEYGKFVEAGGAVPQKWEDQTPHPSRPVVYVSWDEAQAYCKWAKVRLPTEEEWELAARGTAKPGEVGRRYPWGNDDPTDMHANIAQWVGAPTPVGLFPDGRSQYGCDDMSGNVGEWTNSWYDDKEQRTRVVRGGSWDDTDLFARCAYRYYFVPEYHNDILGFRSARI